MEFSRHEVGQIKKPQTAHRIDYGLVHENPWLIILTSIELVQENSQDIQILIKKLHDLFTKEKNLYYQLK